MHTRGVTTPSAAQASPQKPLLTANPGAFWQAREVITTAHAVRIESWWHYGASWRGTPDAFTTFKAALS